MLFCMLKPEERSLGIIRYDLASFSFLNSSQVGTIAFRSTKKKKEKKNHMKFAINHESL